MSIKDLWNRHEFQEQVLKSDMPVLVLFYQLISQDSKDLLATVEKLGEEYWDRIHVVRINMDLSDLLNADWHIQHVPTALLFHDGRCVMRWVNEQNPQIYRQEIDSRLAKVRT